MWQKFNIICWSTISGTIQGKSRKFRVDFNVIQGLSRDFDDHWISRGLLEFQAIVISSAFKWFQVISRDFKGFNHLQVFVIVFLWFLKDLKGFIGISKNLIYDTWWYKKFSWKLLQWISMDFKGFQVFSRDIKGFQLFSRDS